MLPVEDGRTVLKRRLVQFQPRILYRGQKRHKHPHGLQQRRHRLTNEGLFEVTVPEQVALLEGTVKERAKKTSKELVRIRRVVIGFLSYVKITNLIGMQIRRPVTVRTH